MHFEGFVYIKLIRWGARATGTNFDWCLTPGIHKTKSHFCHTYVSPHGVQEPGKLGDKKCQLLFPPYIHVLLRHLLTTSGFETLSGLPV
jgi:hypothetical protein